MPLKSEPSDPKQSSSDQSSSKGKIETENSKSENTKQEDTSVGQKIVKQERNGKQGDIPYQLSNTSPLTLVIDIDETLVHSWQDPLFCDDLEIYTQHFNKFYPPGEDPFCYSICYPKEDLDIWGLIRPHCRKFIEFVTEYFENIVIWSAGNSYYVREVVKTLFHPSKLMNHPKIIHCRADCVRHQKGFYHKPISRLIKFLQNQGIGTRIDLARTLVLDDKDYTFNDNVDNGVLIPPFLLTKSMKDTPTLKELLNRKDDCLLQFIDWVKKVNLRNVPDVRTLDKSAIFVKS